MPAFVHGDPEDHRFVVRTVDLDVLDPEIDVALVLVELRQLVLVLLELLVLEHTGPGKPREHPPTPRLHLLAELALAEGACALEDHVLDLHLRRFGDFKRDRPATGIFVYAGDGFDGGLLVTRLLVELLDLERVGEELALAQRLAGLGGDLLPDLAVAVFLVPGKGDRGNRRVALDHVGQLHAFGRDLFADPDVVEVARGVELADVVVDARPPVVVAFLQADVRPHQRVADGRGTDVPDVDLGDLGGDLALGAGLDDHGAQRGHRQPRRTVWPDELTHPAGGLPH